MLLRWCVLACVPFGILANGIVSKGAEAEVARIATYETASGESYFALSLQSKLGARAATPKQVVVLFDTSASQAGVYRTDSLEVLKGLISGLEAKDEVKLLAVDMKAVPMSAGFMSPGSAEFAASLAKLKQRAPLGSTDLLAALDGAVAAFEGRASAGRAVVYIGDGLSRANLIGSGELSAGVEKLVAARIPVSAVAIGPRRDAKLLATIANHTGGMLYVDSNDQQSPQRAALAMVSAVQGNVAWPSQVKVSGGLKEIYPRQVPPLRSDRDTVVVGMLGERTPQSLEMKVEMNGAVHSLSFSGKPAASSEDFAFLPRLVEDARTDKGISLAALGSAGLAEVRRMSQVEASDLAKMGGKALASGDSKGAAKLAQAALAADPASPQAALVHTAASRRQADGESGLRLVNTAAEAPVDTTENALLPAFESEPGAFLNAEESRRSLQEQVTVAEVTSVLNQARNAMGSNPQTALELLKAQLGRVERAEELSAERRAQLRDTLESAIREGSNRKREKDASDQEVLANRSAATERSRILESLDRREETVKQLVERMRSLINENRFREAEIQVANQVRELLPDSTIDVSTREHTQMMRQFLSIMEIREKRWLNFADAMLEVEKSLVPFPDDPPLVYPPAKEWEELTARRKKYASIDLAKRGGPEERILNALNDLTEIDAVESPLNQVVEHLSARHNIPIVLDAKALEAAVVMADQRVQLNIKGVSLRSALRLLLKPLNLTYVVRNEVLLITTPAEAETELVRKVYPVADLVLPISSGTSANPFQLGGGLGGQGGFGGQQGGQQGGAGGQQGGQGFGGQGGAFAVEESLTLGSKKESPKPVAIKVERPIAKESRVVAGAVVKPAAGQTLEQAWDSYFAARASQTDEQLMQTRAEIRQTVRELLEARKFDEVVVGLNSALRNGHSQSWMYESLALSLQARSVPLEQIADELERALMSAVDFSESGDETMFVASFLSRSGLEKRALKLYRDLAEQNPSRPEPYVHALSTAQRIGDLATIQWASLGILRQAWPKDQAEIEANASRAALAVIEQLSKAGKVDEARKFQEEAKKASMRDCRIEVSWTGEADVDLLVEEPSGSVCSLRTPRTQGGGVIVGDSFAHQGAGIAREVYLCPEGFSGEYRMLLRRIIGKVTAGTVTVDIYTHYGSPQQTHLHKQIPLSDKDALVVFDLKEGRRTQPLAEAQIENIAKVQANIGRAVLAQQLNAAVGSNEAGIELATDRRLTLADGQVGRNGRGGRGGVGFRPVITTLPEGANMTATAVISADRRYVRITAVPLFSFIGDVTTFNFSGGTGAGTGTGVNNGAGAGNPPAAN